jgi:hypothetical protein
MKMKPLSRNCIRAVVPFAIISLALSGCGPQEASVETDPVAIRVGDRDIRLSELQAQVDYSAATGSLVAANEEEFLERYLERQLHLHNAYAAGLDQDIEIRRQWENLLIGRLKKNALETQLASVSVTDEEVEAYYQANIESYTKPAQVHLALLFMEDSGKLSVEQQDALRLQLEQARQQVQELPEGTRGFGALAMKYSEEATSRFKGGDVGWLQASRPRYRWPDEVVATAFSLRENGAMSPVIETDSGVYVLMRIDARAEVVQTLEGRLIASVHNKILKAKRVDLTAQLKREWATSVAVALQNDVIAELKFPSQTDSAAVPQALTRLP